MKKKLIGLDIGTSSIRVASIKRVGQQFFLESIATTPAPKIGVASNLDTELEALSRQILKMFESSNIKTRDVALSLPENQVYTKVIEMPQLSPRELTAALKFEMEQYVPLPIDKVKTDWEILGKNDDSVRPTMNVMLVAAPISLLAKYQRVLDGAHLTAEIVETEIISVYRSLLPLLLPPYSNMIVHIGATGTTVALVRGGVIKMIFSISLGGIALTRSISLDLGIDMSQAENYKNAYGLNTEAFEGKIAATIQPVLDSIVADIKKGLLSFREKNNNESIKQVILSGGSAHVPGLDIFLTNALSTQVVFGSAFTAYNIQNVPEELNMRAPSYNVVLGLALRNLI